MTLLTSLVIGTACTDQLDNPKVNPSDGKQVEVSLNIGFANEDDGFSLSNTRSNNTTAGEKAPTQKLAFDAQLISEAETRAESAKPDKLYNLEIRQYNSTTGAYISSPGVIAEHPIGSSLNVSLTRSDNCQLVIVAWGTSISNRLGTGTFSKACDVMIDQSAIKDLDPTNADDMKKMPYYIYLPSVKVSSNTITSPDGTDVRLLLKRLATRVTLNWDYAYTTDYNLKEVRLEAVPTNYRAIPFINTTDNTYPSLFDQYTTIIVPDNITNQGSYSCWIPATLRGTSNKATSAYYRNKENAPTGSVYATFVAHNKNSEKKKLNYRLYLGSNTSDNFDLNPNTNYNYQINFAHKGLPTNDRRVSIIDPIPASEGNDFLSPTANCFMVAPGGAFCFDPFAYRQNGTDIENSTLKSWANNEGGITSVKLIWQTKENGDLGDPVMGVVNSATDHSNIVEIKRIDGGSGAPTQKGQARIYCRVAPNTTGGSGLIAAYNASNQIIWSWHVWVTTYNPDPTGNKNILEPVNKRKQKYVKAGVEDQLPMMDRNLGAMAGFVTLPTDPIEMSKASGFHYQGGRKDPFPSSYSSKVVFSVDFNVNQKTPPIGMLNQYGPDGLTYFPHQGNSGEGSYRDLYKYPYLLFKTISSSTNWNTVLKNEHDPCPAGWRMPEVKNYKALFEDEQYISINRVDAMYQARGYSEDMTQFLDNGNGNGYLLYYDDTHVSYFRMTGYPPFHNQFRYIGTCGNLRTREIDKGFTFGNSVIGTFHSFCIGVTWNKNDAHTTRCIQECE